MPGRRIDYAVECLDVMPGRESRSIAFKQAGGI